MNVQRNEKGYSLVITIFILVLVSILGVSLITLTANGMAKNTNRENNVRALDLADKGLEFITSDIQQVLSKEISANPMTKSEFNSYIDELLGKNQYACTNNNNTGFNIPAADESYTYVCIEAVSKVKNQNNFVEEKDLYKRKVTFKSVGMVNGVEKVVKSDVIFGTDLIPDQLKYAVSTNDDGNLYLHGGVQIKGDVKTDGHLIISNRATWMSGSNAIWQPSVGATIIKSDDSDVPKIIMNERVPIEKGKEDTNKYIYVLKNGDPDYNQHITGTILNGNQYTKFIPESSNVSNIQNALFNTNNLKIVTKSIPDDKVKVDVIVEEQASKVSKKAYKQSVGIYSSDHELTKLNKNDTVYLTAMKWVEEKEPYTVREKYCVRSGLFSCKEYGYRDVVKYSTQKVEVPTKGSLNISAEKTSNKNFTIKGIYYINGDLNINNVNLYTDAMFYVNGNVNIKDSKINEGNPNSSLIIFANGSINVSNISVDSPIDNPSTIKGFFYSEQNLILYGVGSNINLHGGISAKRVILTGVRGKAKNDSYDSIETQKTKDSRLKIIYDESLINQYTSFKRDELEEFIQKVNDPEIVNKY